MQDRSHQVMRCSVGDGPQSRHCLRSAGRTSPPPVDSSWAPAMSWSQFAPADPRVDPTPTAAGASPLAHGSRPGGDAPARVSHPAALHFSAPLARADHRKPESRPHPGTTDRGPPVTVVSHLREPRWDPGRPTQRFDTGRSRPTSQGCSFADTSGLGFRAPADRRAPRAPFLVEAADPMRQTWHEFDRSARRMRRLPMDGSRRLPPIGVSGSPGASRPSTSSAQIGDRPPTRRAATAIGPAMGPL